jgi:GNAT superfamily N-acetyltransferase
MSSTKQNTDKSNSMQGASVDSLRFHIRPARLDDKEVLMHIVALSVRELSREDYSEQEIEGALKTIFGIDTELINDGTYFAVEAHIDGTVPIIVGCGGWSKRKTLFGGDQFDGRESEELNPATDAAKVRAFFVHPAWARRGIGTLILQECERAAKASGFTQLELMATLPGEKLYRTYGFAASPSIQYDMGENGMITFVPMKKTISI